MKNLLIFFTSLVVLSPTVHSSAIISKRGDHKRIFMEKFKNTYEFTKTNSKKSNFKQTKKQQFENLFEQVRKQ